jgi:drug/metabolite transporter (DMT)-like permease
MALITGLCWATLAIALRQALQYASTGTIVWFRLVVALFCLVAFYAVYDAKKLKIFWPLKRWVVVAGLGLALNYFAYMRGIELTSASNAQIMIQLGPLLLLLFGVFYFGERPTKAQTIGLAIASLGFLLFFWEQVLISLSDVNRFLAGDLWLLIAAVAWALFAVLQKGLKQSWSPQQFNMVIYLICTLALWPTAHISELTSWDLPVWLLMIGCGINTLVAYGAFAEALRRAPASHVSLIISANPLLTIFLLAWLSGIGVTWVTPEPIHWRGLLGAGCVVCGVCLTVWRRRPLSYKSQDLRPLQQEHSILK